MTLQFNDFDIKDLKVKNGTVIEASAGTGKTFSVAAIVAKSLALDDGLRINNILVTTFTRNAAAELMDRIRRRLVSLERQLRSDKIEADDELALSLSCSTNVEMANRLARALREFDTATIATIHSICARILTMAGLPVVGDSDQNRLMAILNEVTNDVVIEEASNGRIYDSEKLKKVVELKLSSPLALLDYNRSIDSSDSEVINSELEQLIIVVETCVTRIRKRTLLEPTFDDMLRRTAEILADRTQIGLITTLRQRFTLAVIDEAQDTDKLQWNIFKTIFEETSTTHTLLAVGDPKQAIYRFRGADIGAYLSMRQNEKLLTLRKNWRSDEGLLKALNHLFNGWSFGPFVEYVPVVPRDGAPFSAISSSKPLTIIDIGEVGDNSRVASPAARRVREILETMKITVDGKQRVVNPSDVCVLVTSKSNGAKIESFLRGMGVSAVSSGTENVMNGEMADSFVRLFSAMDNAHNASKIRLAAASLFFGEDLATAGALDEKRIEEIQRELIEWTLILRRRGVAGLAAKLRSVADISTRIVAGDKGDRRETDFAHIVELLHRETIGAACSPSLVIEVISELRQHEAQSETVSRRVESDRDAVQIMTVHAAKGLEFPIVVVADLWKKTRNASGPNFFNRPSASDSSKNERVIDVGYVIGKSYALADQGRKNEEADEVSRLFYVALTRAKHHVSLIVGTPKSRAPKSKAAPEVRVTNGLTEVGRFAEVLDVVETISASNIKTYPGYVSQANALGTLAVASFTGSTKKTYERLSFSGVSDRRSGKSESSLSKDDRSGAGHNDDDNIIISIRSGYADSETPLGVPEMPFARLVGGTYFGKIMHTVYENVDFAQSDLRNEVARVIDEVVTGDLKRNHRDELIDGVVLSLQTPMGANFDKLTLQQITLRNRLNELRFEMSLASLSAGVTVNDMGRALVKCLKDAGREDDVLAPYAHELCSAPFAIPLVGLMNGSIDTLIRVTMGEEQGLYVTDWKSNRLDEDGMENLIDGYSRELMMAEMEHHHYPLQALIYGAAVYRYVRSRTEPGADAVAVKGLAYYFIRGMVGEHTPVDDFGNRHGVFTWEAPPGLWESLSDVMSGMSI